MMDVFGMFLFRKTGQENKQLLYSCKVQGTEAEILVRFWCLKFKEQQD